VGADTGLTYRLGDAVTVRLVEAAPVAGALRFELVSEGRHEPRRRAQAPRRPKKLPRRRRG
jgi:ribonuclease R